MNFSNKAARQDYLLKLEIEQGDGVEVDWEDIQNKPAVLAGGDTQEEARDAIGAGTSNLEIGDTASTAKRGDWVPSYADITNKPATFPPTIGTTSSTAKAGDWVPSSEDLPDATTEAKGAVKMGAAVPDAADEGEVVSTINALLASLRSAGIISG